MYGGYGVKGTEVGERERSMLGGLWGSSGDIWGSAGDIWGSSALLTKGTGDDVWCDLQRSLEDAASTVIVLPHNQEHPQD